MAKTAKRSYRVKLVEAHNALVTISKEMEDFEAIRDLATSDTLKEKMNAISKRYEADFTYLSDKINYMLGKAVVEDVTIRTLVLKSLLDF